MPGLVASYNIQPGNREGLFWFQCFINLSLTYLLEDTYPLTDSARTQTGHTWHRFTRDALTGYFRYESFRQLVALTVTTKLTITKRKYSKTIHTVTKTNHKLQTSH